MKRNLNIMVGLLLLLSSCAEEGEKEVVAQDLSTLSKTEINEFLDKGDEIVLNAFTTLSSNLKEQMSAGGVEKAVSFCNLSALSITDSLSNYFNVDIKRTSLKLRNQSNEPTEAEQNILHYFSDKIIMGETPVSIVKKDEEGIHYYAPIFLNKPLCLTCHGTVGKTVSDSNYAIIKSYYPSDSATGYQQDELRGIWSLTFGNNK